MYSRTFSYNFICSWFRSSPFCPRWSHWRIIRTIRICHGGWHSITNTGNASFVPRGWRRFLTKEWITCFHRFRSEKWNHWFYAKISNNSTVTTLLETDFSGKITPNKSTFIFWIAMNNMGYATKSIICSI